MRKLITLLSAISFLTTSVASVTACGVGLGDIIRIDFGNEPTKATAGQDPITNYVYNDDYIYDMGAIKKALWPIFSLAVTKIKDKQATFVVINETWSSFYQSDGYKNGHYDSFKYNADKAQTQPFSFKDQNNNNFLTWGLTDNDATKQRRYGYWFVTSAVAGGPITNNTSIVIPNPSEFTVDHKIICKEGWVHFALTMGVYQIDFNCRINIYFEKDLDKNNQEWIRVNGDTYDRPMGSIDYDHPELTYNDCIKDLQIKEVQ